MRLTFTSPHPYLRRFGHGLYVARHISAPLSPCLIELWQLSVVGDLTSGSLAAPFTSSVAPFTGLATHGILCQTIFESDNARSLAWFTVIFAKENRQLASPCGNEVGRGEQMRPLKALHLIASLVSQFLIKKFLMKKKRLAPSHLSEPLLVWSKSSEHRAPKIGRAV